MRNLIIVLALASVTACVDSEPQVEEYSCLIRFQCVGSDDILARQYFTCATDEQAATDDTQATSLGVAEDRCGKGAWRFTWSTCDSQPVPDTAALCARDSQ